MKTDPKAGRADGLRRAMPAYMNDKSGPSECPSGFLDRFSLIGEGAAR
jgi:hypothetical protein